MTARSSGISVFGGNVIRRLWAQREDPFMRQILRTTVRDARWLLKLRAGGQAAGERLWTPPDRSGEPPYLGPL